MSLPQFPQNLTGLDFENAVCQILSSIAMEELGLSHIINAEGEKLQYVLGTLKDSAPAEPSTVEQVLEVNESVMEMLQQIGFTQMFLTKKMSDALKAYDKYQKNGGTKPKEEVFYKPVGKPPNVYEIVDKDGNGKQPPEYIYNPGTPGDGKDRDAYRDENGNFWVEEKPPGNVWIPINDKGSLDFDNAVWGGPNGKPGGGDDKPVEKFGNAWWIDMGQNVFKEVTGPFTLGPLTGGGPSRNPALTPGKPVYESNTGQYFIKNGTDMYGNDLYYGDPMDGSSNGLLDSTQTGRYGDDVIYYMDKDGNMTTKQPITVVSVIIDPPSAIIQPGGARDFNAQVELSNGKPSPAGVAWSISPIENIALSSETTSGVTVTAGSNPSPTKFILTATSNEDGKIKGTAEITITSKQPSNVTVTLSPDNATYTVGNPPLQFTARVSGDDLVHGEDNDAVTWTVSPALGATVENGNFSATQPGIYTVKVTAKDDPTATATATVTVKANGKDDIGSAKIGDTITIDKNDWIKIREDMEDGELYVLLMLKDTIGEFAYAPNSTGTVQYASAAIKDNVDEWYRHLDAPTLKSIASFAQTGSAPTPSWHVKGDTGIKPHLPRKIDVQNLKGSALAIDKDYWLANPTSVSGGGNAFQEIVKFNGGDGKRSNSMLAHARPIIWVKAN